ncbi:hypothetical protein [Donghicola eburneus]|uniref:hypothetical protein n=1 Tax=Donghicola eburneus TaxID=393278 RepID=UPI0008EEA9F8|nr:hypothetical protein [Donghicola eburneus]SFQ77763.1 hypothetical protein SAMN05421764_12016 [Donghicola eburneus]
MHLTHHASRRIQQRGIPGDVLKIIRAYGSARHAGGVLSLTLDTQAIMLASEDDRHLRAKLEKYSGCYAIVAEGDRAVTVAHRSRRFRNNGFRRAFRKHNRR